jgi:Pectate lyase superfamily protein
MSIVQISRISHRSGLNQNLPQLSKAELGYSVDTRQLFIGNGTLNDGAPETGNTEILTEYSDILNLANTYSFKNIDAGYNPQTGNARAVYNAVAYGNSTYVAVGSGGHILYSLDGVTWTNTTSGTTSNLTTITYGSGTFVAGGANGTVIYSSDGKVWQKSGAVSYTTVNNIAFGNSLFVAVTLLGGIYTSSTGVTWTARTSGITTPLNSVVFGSTKFVAVGSGGVILTSSDNTATSWSSQTVGNSDLLGIDYQGSTYVATGKNSKALYSSDGTTWYRSLIDTFVAVTSDSTFGWAITSWGDVYKATTTSFVNVASVASGIENFTNIYYSNNFFIALTGSGGIYTSSDGTTWTSRTSGVSTGLNEVYYDSVNKIFTIVGDSGVILTASPSGGLPQVTTWVSQTSGTTNNLLSISQLSSTTWIAVGASGTILTSPNATTWTTRSSGVTVDLRSVTVADLGGGTYKAIAVGRGGIGITSSVGTTWTTALSNSATDPTGATVSVGDLNQVIYLTFTTPSNVTYSYYIAVGDNGRLLLSSNSTTWYTKTTYTVSDFQGIAYSGTYFYAVGDIGLTYITGRDASTWTANSVYYSANLLTPDVYSLATNGTYNVIVGQYGYTYHSTSQYKYFRQGTQQLYDTLNNIIYTTKFVAVGASGQVSYSSDGIAWTSLSFSYGGNSTVRSLQRKLDDFVSVKDFGAKGDGVTDDTEAINRALYEIYCRTTSISARKTLYFPAGNYVISASINVPSHARIIGEGTFNTQITQTANPYVYPYVTWVMYTADNLQQTGNLIGLNGAGLPTDITITNLTLQSLNDGIIIDSASRVTLDNVRLQGPISSVITGTDAISGNTTAGVKILGRNLAFASDVNMIDCLFNGFNSGVYLPASQYASNALIDSCTFYNLYYGIYLIGANSKGFTLANSVMDAIYQNGVYVINSNNFTSLTNYFKDVGDHLNGASTPSTTVIYWDNTAVGCSSIGDSYDRTDTNKVSETANSNEWNYSEALRLGTIQHNNGESLAIAASTTAVLATGYDDGFTGVIANILMDYSISRNGGVRTGMLKFSLTSSGVYSIDDDSTQNSDVGVTFGFNGTDLTYTSDGNGTGLLNYAIRYLEML